MILVVAGTRDGRELAAALGEQGFSVLLSTWSEYGRQLAGAEDKYQVRSGPLDGHGFRQLLSERAVQVVVDASHPYAVQVSQQLMEACAQGEIPYIRYERQSVSFTAPGVIRVADFKEAAEQAARLGNTVFLAIGSRQLTVFTSSGALRGKRLVARVLPDAAVIRQCQELGFLPANLVALQGPFSQELNQALLRQFKAEVLVTKESGSIGGTEEKVAAALAEGIPVVLVGRPAVEYPVIVSSAEAAIAYIRRMENGIYLRPHED